LIQEIEKIPMDREEKRTYDFERIEALIEEGGGLVKTGDILALGIDYRRILKFTEEGLLHRVKSGYYSLGKGGYSEVEMVSAMFPDGVLTLEAGLYAQGYLSVKPSHWCIAISKNTSKSRFAIDYPVLVPYYSKDEVLSLGVEEKTFDGVSMKVYTIDRLICDVLKYEGRMEHEDFRKAVLAYIADRKKDVEKLKEYAAQRKVLRKVQDMIGVWL